jgi:pimeloyl-ACP methyl ester carboxylesterase
MTKRSTVAVFIHGNPESPALWGPLLRELELPGVICLSPPGFGSPLFRGFQPTMKSYSDWLINVLESFAAPVDLVGHDWGGIHTLNAVAARPDLVRSWVSDAVGVFHPAYEWHPLAKVWQTPGEGEAAIYSVVEAPLLERIQQLRTLGIGDIVADQLAAAMDDDMAKAILGLYRSAAQPTLAEAGRTLGSARSRPGLVISPSDDSNTGNLDTRTMIARQLSAEVAELDGLGHWWMVQDPIRGAATLRTFWQKLP